MDSAVKILVLLCSSSAFAQNWQVLKKFNLNSIEAVKSEWEVETHDPGFVNHELQQYTDSQSTLFIRDGHLIVKAYRQNGRYYSGRIHSKNTFSVSDAPGEV